MNGQEQYPERAALTREIPSNIEAERAVLGAMFISREAIAAAVEILNADDFYRQSHRVIFDTMVELYNKNEGVDLITMVESLKRRGKLDDVGGIAYITGLANEMPTAAGIKYHAEILSDVSVLRKLVDVSTEITTMAYDGNYEGNEEVGAILDRAESRILEVAQKKKKSDFVPINQILDKQADRLIEIMGNPGALTGLPTGFVDFDNLTSGLHPSDFIILAARPSMGKTALALNIVQNVAVRSAQRGEKDKKAVAFFSLEMSKEQLVDRMICAEAGIDSQKLRVGQLSEEEQGRFWEACNNLSRADIYIDDTAGLTALDMRSRARRLKVEKKRLDLLVVDYLQLMQGSGKRSNAGDNRQQEVSEISRFLKALARELEVPVLALSQLSRSVESRTTKKPMLSDLRESGSLEQDADIVAFLYREDYYNPETEVKHTELIIAKHRNGPVGMVPLFFDKRYTRFSSLSRRE